MKPAPPTAVGPLSEDGVGGDENAFVNQGGLGADEWVDWSQLKSQMAAEDGGAEEDDSARVHVEL